MKKIKNRKQHVKNRESNLLQLGFDNFPLVGEAKDKYKSVTDREPNVYIMGKVVRNKFIKDGLKIKRGKQ
jgi:hypothetical protein